MIKKVSVSGPSLGDLGTEAGIPAIVLYSNILFASYLTSRVVDFTHHNSCGVIRKLHGVRTFELHGWPGRIPIPGESERSRCSLIMGLPFRCICPVAGTC